jgi:S-formylglutathione hydrolase FrmB
MPLTRRSLLLGAGSTVAVVAAAGVAVDEGWLPGRYRVRRALGLTGSFVSQDRLGTAVGCSVIYPGPRPERPVMVSLHRLGGDHTTAVTELGMDRFLPTAARAGVRPFAIATVDGGTTYWHRRPTGEDAAAMVLEEFLPTLGRLGLDTSRLAFQGWSMGGYGALRLAAQVGPGQVRAVAALSPALWTDPDDASTDGFADAAEYRQFSVMGHQGDLNGIAVRVDCGREDPFYPADRAYVDGFDRPVTATFEDGTHDAAYWTRIVPAQLAFVGRELQS